MQNELRDSLSSVFVTSAGDGSSDRHECTKSAPTLHHGLSHLANELSSSEAVSEASEATKENACTDADETPHHEPLLNPVEAAGFFHLGSWKHHTIGYRIVQFWTYIW